ncbi:MAG: division plane positioning ATPase MipZ, partial [Rhizomicrobium sp.]
MPHVIVFGNEKGGSGKTTAAIHVAVALAREGRRVGAIDLDVRQRSFSRHLENRAEWGPKTGG